MAAALRPEEGEGEEEVEAVPPEVWLEDPEAVLRVGALPSEPGAPPASGLPARRASEARLLDGAHVFRRLVPCVSRGS